MADDEEDDFCQISRLFDRNLRFILQHETHYSGLIISIE
jgi:hypothetical protein